VELNGIEPSVALLNAIETPSKGNQPGERTIVFLA